MKPYTHPGNPRTVMQRYRAYILNTKRVANENRVSQGKPIAKRAARALVHYRGYLDQYLAAKRIVLNGGT